jgi:DNA-binding transcriptional ArsR family regulator
MAHSKAPLFQNNYDDDFRIATYARALAYPGRVIILRWLANEGPRHPAEISEFLGLSMSTTSHHLAMLERTGLITGHERGPYIVYFFNTPVLPEVRDHFAWLFRELDTGK